MNRCSLMLEPLLAVALVLQCGCGRTTDKVMLMDTNSSYYKVGQVWRYRTRPGEEASTLTIVKVESEPKLGIIVHVSVSGLKIRSSKSKTGFAENISHLPFAEEAIRSSV